MGGGARGDPYPADGAAALDGRAAVPFGPAGAAPGDVAPIDRHQRIEAPVGGDADPAEFLARTFSETDGYDEMVVLNGLRFISYDAETGHPMPGTVSIGYLPRHRVVGVSKLSRVVDLLANRLQTPERLAGDVATTIDHVLAPHGVAVVLAARHPALPGGAHVIARRMFGQVADDPATRRQFDAMTGTPAP